MVSYYQVLGISEDSSQDQIRQAYLERMKAHHSDRHGQSDDPIVRIISEAYHVLGNPTDRERYNKRLRRSGNCLTYVESQPVSTNITQTSPRTRKPQNGNSEICGRCKGRGFNPVLGVGWTCQYCGGQGWVPGKISL